METFGSFSSTKGAPLMTMILLFGWLFIAGRGLQSTSAPLRFKTSIQQAASHQEGSGTTCMGIGSTNDYDQMNFHKVLELVGKTVLRPGGRQATERLHHWAANSFVVTENEADTNLDDAVTCLEVAAGLGKSGMALAQTYGVHVVLTDVDESRLQTALAEAVVMGLEHLITTQTADMFHLDRDISLLYRDGETSPSPSFSAIMTEASLTHFGQAKKRQFFQGTAKVAPHILIHEICLADPIAEDSPQAKAICRDMGQALHIGFVSETRERWVDLLEEANYKIEQLETGPLQVLDPLKVWKEEGTWGMWRILKNIATNPKLRARLFATAAVVNSNKKYLNYIILHAAQKRYVEPSSSSGGKGLE
jgi:hypothetical protein